MSPAFVTGASGFLGRRLAAALRARGRRVLALARDAADLEMPGIEVVAGRLEDPESYRGYLPCGATVFHLAAARGRPGTPRERFAEVNVRGSRELARAALERGAARFVHLSTALVFGPAGQRPRSERDGYQADAGQSPYVASRIAAARQLRRLAAAGLPLVIVSPTIVFGPDHPNHPNLVTAHLRRTLRSRWDLVLGGGRQRRDLVYVDDVVTAILTAERRGEPGEELLVGGEATCLRQLNRQVRRLAGQPDRPTLSLPRPMAVLLAGLADRLAGRSDASGYTDAVRHLTLCWRFDSSAARRRLDHRPLPLEEGLRRTLALLGDGDGDAA